jgi:outer membrane receptor protein involved in Fe transport
VNSFIAGPFNGTNGETFTGTTSGNTFDPRAVITWQPNSTGLFYVSGAKGYRPGGYNAQVNNAQPACQTRLQQLNLTVPRTYAPDSIWSVEAGTKQRLLDNRLAIDFSVYHNNWDNIQLSEQIADCGFGAILNLGSAITQGFDLNLESRIGDHLKLDLAVGYTSGHFTSDAFVGDPAKGAPQVVSKGEQITAVPGAIPPWTITASFEYDFNVMRHDAYFRLEDTYHSSNGGQFAQQTNPLFVTYDPLTYSEPSNNILNLKLGVRVRGVDAAFFADNLANAHPLMAPFHVGIRGPNDSDPRYFFQTFTPRTLGVLLTANF